MDNPYGKTITTTREQVPSAASLARSTIECVGEPSGLRVAPPPPPIIRLLGVELHRVSEIEAIQYILDQLDADRGGVVVTPNLDHLRRCQTDKSFGAFVAEAELVVADGMPLVWASRIQGTPLPQRVAGSDLITSLSAAAAGRGKSIFLLGGSPGTAEGAAQILKRDFPTLRVAGTCCPPMGFEHDPVEYHKLEAQLSAARPDIVFVALGSPKQEQLIERIRQVLPRAWWLGVGVSFSFLTGHVKRAPKWIQSLGIEWVHRLCQEPRRLFKRYLIQGIPFAGLLMIDAAAQRVRMKFSRGANHVPFYRRPDRFNGHALTTRVYDSGSPSTQPAFIENALDGLESAHAAANGAMTAADVELAGENTIGLLAENRIVTQNGVQGSGAESAETEIDPVSARSAARSRRGPHALHRLRAVALLGGQLRPSPLMQAIERSVLDLPVLHDRTLLNHWLVEIAELGLHAGLEKLPTRLLVSQGSEEIHSASESQTLTIERDASALRGTGGVLADLARGYEPEDFILVANAAQLLLEPLTSLVVALDFKRSDLALISHLDGTPGGLMLIRCGVLKPIKSVGYIDMKEQALPRIARQFDVRVVQCRRPTGLPLRTTSDYIGAMRHWHRGIGVRPGSRRGQLDPLAEDFSVGFSIVETGASVDPSAYLHDSVVLKGARVEANAAVVRSLVGPRAVVRHDTRVIDEGVGGGSRR